MLVKPGMLGGDADFTCNETLTAFTRPNPTQNNNIPNTNNMDKVETRRILQERK